MKKKIYYVFVVLFTVFLFALLLNISWTNARVVENVDSQVSPFFGMSPFFSGLLVVVIVGLLILIVEHNK